MNNDHLSSYSSHNQYKPVSQLPSVLKVVLSEAHLVHEGSEQKKFLQKEQEKNVVRIHSEVCVMTHELRKKIQDGVMILSED